MADIKGAYPQSGPIQQQIFVRRRRKGQGKGRSIWRPAKLPYRVVEAGRQWQKIVGYWMLSEGKVERAI